MNGNTVLQGGGGYEQFERWWNADQLGGVVLLPSDQLPSPHCSPSTPSLQIPVSVNWTGRVGRGGKRSGPLAILLWKAQPRGSQTHK